jgi:hypothetical protein
MKRARVLLVISLFVSVGIYSQDLDFNYQSDFDSILELSKDKDSEFNYEKLLIRFNSNDSTLTDYEILSLLIGFTGTPQYIPYGYKKIEFQIQSLVEEGKFREAISKADSLLSLVPLSLYAINYKIFAFSELGQQDSVQYCLWKSKRIFNVMSGTGDGKSAETAIFSLGPYDGDFYLYIHLGMNIMSTNVGNDSYGNTISILSVSQDEELYFQIEHAFKSMDNSKNYMKYFGAFENRKKE